MAATLYVPTPLRKLTNGKSKVQIDGTSIAELIERAEAEYPGFRDRVLDSNGEVKRFINVFVNGVDMRTMQGKATTVKDGDEVSFIPAMAGGRPLESQNGRLSQ
ncbi:MAG: MoaD/ThiS family protein [Chloroflexi bacterium]|nr:MoaD/ThiS family protein [Chloroflexota bacterium]